MARALSKRSRQRCHLKMDSFWRRRHRRFQWWWPLDCCGSNLTPKASFWSDNFSYFRYLQCGSKKKLVVLFICVNTRQKVHWVNQIMSDSSKQASDLSHLKNCQVAKTTQGLMANATEMPPSFKMLCTNNNEFYRRRRWRRRVARSSDEIGDSALLAA